jgi:hypothetical protein
MKNALSTFCALMGALLSLSAQELHVVEYLRKTSRSGIVLARNQLPKSNEHSVSTALQWLHTLEKGQLRSEDCMLPNAMELQSTMKDIQLKTGWVPLGIGALNFEACALDGISDTSWKPIYNDAVLSGIEELSLSSHSSVFAFTDLEVEAGEVLRGYFSSALRFVSPEIHVSDLQLQDPLSGKWQDIQWDVPFDLDMGHSDLLSFRCRLGDVWHTFSLRVTRAMCTSDFPSPDPNVPWQFLDDSPLSISPWEISTVAADGSIVGGNAYYLPSGTFDKPFIFVEGIDFSYYHDAERNGSLGWCQFTSGNTDPNYDYWFLFNLRNLLTDLREQGFDIIMLDFYDGAGDITRSSALTQHLIRMVNASKVGDHPNVLSGASMGGIVTRHALCTMENQNEQHCTGLWVSLDSPHSGANIPLALQQMIYHLSGQPQAASFINDMLSRPAARQLLHIQYHPLSPDEQVFSPPSYVSFFQELEQLGFPSYCKSIGVTNGSLMGAPIWGSHYQYLMDENCELSGCSEGPESRFFMTGTQGDPGYSDWFGIQPNAEWPISSQFVRSSPVAWQDVAVEGLLYGLFSAYQLYACDFPKTVQIGRTRAGMPNFDRMSGGTRPSIDELAYAINNSGILQDAGCTEVSIYIPVHSFIATYSGLALPFAQDVPSVLVQMENQPELCPFDRVLGPMYNNEPHSFVSEDTRIAIREEALALSQIIAPVELTQFSPNGGWFNMGDAAFTQVPSTVIHNQGMLTINHEGFVHFGEQPENFTFPGSHYDAYIMGGCVGNGVMVRNNGLLSVGDPSGSRTATLHVRGGGYLKVDDLGSLLISPGSSLSVENGGLVEVMSQSMVRLIGYESAVSSIVVREGGVLRLHSAVLRLIENYTEIRLEGGVLEVMGNESMVFGDGASCGQLLCRTTAPGRIHMEETATLTLRGSDTADTIVEIADAGELAISGNGRLEIERCALLFEGQCTMSHMGDFLAVSTHWSHLSTEEGGQTTVSVTGNKVLLFSSVSDDLNWYFNADRLAMQGDDFSGRFRSINIDRGQYDIIESTFSQIRIHAYGSQETNRVTDCDFFSSSPFTALTDEANDRLILVRNTFDGGQAAIKKSKGLLIMQCNSVTNAHAGVVATDFSTVDLSSGRNGGRNYFANNNIHIMLSQVEDLLMMGGGNHMALFNDKAIYGTMDKPCADACNPTQQPCSGNYWGPINPTFASNLGFSIPGTDVQSSSDIQFNCNNNFQLGATNCQLFIIDLGPNASFAGCGSLPIAHGFRSGEHNDILPADSQVDDLKAIVFPNPTSGRVTIPQLDPELESIMVLDCTGRVVHCENVLSDEWSWEFSPHLSAGWYCVRLVGAQGVRNLPVLLSR